MSIDDILKAVKNKRTAMQFIRTAVATHREHGDDILDYRFMEEEAMAGVYAAKSLKGKRGLTEADRKNIKYLNKHIRPYFPKI